MGDRASMMEWVVVVWRRCWTARALWMCWVAVVVAVAVDGLKSMRRRLGWWCCCGWRTSGGCCGWIAEAKTFCGGGCGWGATDGAAALLKFAADEQYPRTVMMNTDFFLIRTVLFFFVFFFQINTFFFRSEQYLFFFQYFFFFLDQTGSRVLDCLIVRTIKSRALIPKLMRNKKNDNTKLQ